MVKIIDGDLFRTHASVICHQVNCRGVMGSGVARQVRERYPLAYEAYKKLCADAAPASSLLGTAQAVDIGSKVIYNLFGQDGYGGGKLRTSYDALRACFSKVAGDGSDCEVAMPYRIGCDRGGGDWNIVYGMLEEIFAERELLLYRL